MDSVTTGNTLEQKLEGTVGQIGKYLRIKRKNRSQESNL